MSINGKTLQTGRIFMHESPYYQLQYKSRTRWKKESKIHWKWCMDHTKSVKKEEMIATWGKPETSIVADLELTLANYHVSRAAYRGDNFNRVCCWRIVESAKPICDEVW